MIHFIKHIGVFFLICPAFVFSASLVSVNTPTDDTSEEDASIFTTLSAISKAQETINKKQAELELLKTNQIEEQKNYQTLREEIEALDTQIQNLKISHENSIATLEQTLNVLNSKKENLEDEKALQVIEADIADQQQNIENTVSAYNTRLSELEAQKEAKNIMLESLQKTLDQKLSEKEAAINQLTQDIKERELELERQQFLFKSQLWAFGYKAGIFITILLIWGIFRWGVKKIIANARVTMLRKNVLYRVNKIVFNTLLVIIVLTLFFAQFLSLLPFLAILGTALAFALRDVLVSFFGWFIIGMKNGYRIGETIQIGDVFGRVTDITPLMTVIAEEDKEGDTARVFSFPNKKVFESPIKNYSKLFHFTHIRFIFLLDPESDVEAAKKLIIKTIREKNEDLAELEKNLPNFQLHWNLSEEDIHPKVYVKIDMRGILLTAKTLVKVYNRYERHSEISETFYAQVRKNKKIILRFWEFGEDLDKLKSE